MDMSGASGLAWYLHHRGPPLTGGHIESRARQETLGAVGGLCEPDEFYIGWGSVYPCINSRVLGEGRLLVTRLLGIGFYRSSLHFLGCTVFCFSFFSFLFFTVCTDCFGFLFVQDITTFITF